MGCWNVEVTETAYADALEAARYMRDQLGSKQAAERFIDSFEAQVEALATMPEGRPPVADYDLAKLGYRWCSVGKFMMFYRVNRDEHRVTVDRVLYGARDWASLLS